jgi:hypothetical protein
MPFRSVVRGGHRRSCIDGVQFDFKKLLEFVLEIYGLDVLAKTTGGVCLAITLDGADLSRNVNHVTAGIKIFDPRAIDPVSKVPIGVVDSTKIQSRELCIPFKIVLAKDSKTLYETHIRDFFDFFKELNDGDCHGFKQFKKSSPQDGSSFWKSLERGGACKVAIDFCHACACKSRQCSVPWDVPCSKCAEKNRARCYHWDVGDDATLARVQEELEELKEYPGYDILCSDATYETSTLASRQEEDRHLGH